MPVGLLVPPDDVGVDVPEVDGVVVDVVVVGDVGVVPTVVVGDVGVVLVDGVVVVVVVVVADVVDGAVGVGVVVVVDGDVAVDPPLDVPVDGDDELVGGRGDDVDGAVGAGAVGVDAVGDVDDGDVTVEASRTVTPDEFARGVADPTGAEPDTPP